MTSRFKCLPAHRAIVRARQPRSPRFGLGATLRVVCALVLLIGSTGCRKDAPQAIRPDATPPEGAPRLVVMVVIDQVRADYLDRFAPLLEGGIARLAAEGVSFTEAHQAHAHTVTAVGHATLATGVYPRRHGVIGNGWYSRELGEDIAAVSDEEHGRSPRALEVGTLGDWLKTAYPESKVFGIGGKDRSAMLTAGKKADAAYYYDRDGGFVSSDYYLEEAPVWLDEFHERKWLDRFFGQAWTPLHALDELTEYGIEPVDFGTMPNAFPHPIGGISLYPNDSFYSAIYSTPFVDEYVIELAKALIEGEGLGQDDTPDFLGLTLSAVDSTGHTYGPDSPEMLDTLLRADRALGGFLVWLDRVIGLDNTLITLSSDHGVADIPELHARRGGGGHRIDAADIACVQGLGKELTERFGPEQWLESSLYIDRQLVAEKGLDLEEMQNALADLVGTCPYIERTFTSSRLLGPPPEDLDEIEELFRRSHNVERSPDVELQLAPNTLFSRSVAASHGMPYRYDTHVPWIVMAPGVAAGRVDERVETVDVLPTLASWLGLEVEGAVDGTSRRQWIDTPPAPVLTSTGERVEAGGPGL